LKFNKYGLQSIGLVIYVIAIFCPAFVDRSNVKLVYTGWDCLITGWIGFVSIEAFYIGLPWLSNFVMAAAILISHKKLKLILTIVALMFALCAFGVNQAPGGAGSYPSVLPSIGFGLWILSYLFFLTHAILKFAPLKKKEFD